jgi:hypothetical protein
MLVVSAVEVEDPATVSAASGLSQLADYSAVSLHALAANLAPGATAKTDAGPAIPVPPPSPPDLVCRMVLPWFTGSSQSSQGLRP